MFINYEHRSADRSPLPLCSLTDIILFLCWMCHSRSFAISVVILSNVEKVLPSVHVVFSLGDTMSDVFASECKDIAAGICGGKYGIICNAIMLLLGAVRDIS